MIYYIYHIPGIKIGCTSNLNKRMRDQGFTSWNVLEEHTNIYEVSDREIQLQKEYNLPVDKIPYWKSIENRSKNWNKGNDHMEMMRSFVTEESLKQRSITWKTNNNKITVTNEHRRNSARKQRLITFELAEEIRSKYIPRKYTARMISTEYDINISTIKGIVQNTIYKQP